MFDTIPQGGLMESLAERWREWRGIDHWPRVNATVTKKEWRDGSEGGGYYKITLSYLHPQNTCGPTCHVTLTDNVRAYEFVERGDKILIRVHPTRANRAVFNDISNASHGAFFTIWCVGLALFVLVLHSCR